MSGQRQGRDYRRDASDFIWRLAARRMAIFMPVMAVAAAIEHDTVPFIFAVVSSLCWWVLALNMRGGDE